MLRRCFLSVLGLVVGLLVMADECTSAKLKRVEGVVPLPYNEVLENDLVRMDRVLNRGGWCNWCDWLRNEMEVAGLPTELRLLPLALSNMNEDFADGDRCGVWGLSSLVALRYGLVVDRCHDERFSVEASTGAAIGWLKDLYRMYGDWWSVILAVVNSPSAVNSAKLIQGKAVDVWGVYGCNSLERVSVIPDFMCCCVLCSNLTCDGRLADDSFAEVEIRNNVSVSVLKRLLNVDEKQVRCANRVFRGDVFVPFENHPLLLSKNVVAKWVALEDSVYAESRRCLPMVAKVNVTPQKSTTPNGNKVVYVVRLGDTLGGIAQRFHVRVNDIKRWNNLRSDFISEKQRLVIYKK